VQSTIAQALLGAVPAPALTCPGSQLQVGDVIETHWGIDTITTIAPYTGDFAPFFPSGAQVVCFADSSQAIIVENGRRYTLLARTQVAA
jgi:hypothetical protein